MDSPLEKQLEDAFNELEISQKNRDSIKWHLDLVKHKDEDTYTHCARVGILGIKAAKCMELDSKALFYAGVLHDVGKVLIELGLLRKNERYSAEDWEKMKLHPIYAYNILKDVHAFSAEVAVRHHRYQKDSYPETLPEIDKRFGEQFRVVIEYSAMTLSVLDCHEGAKRVNERSGNKVLSDEEVRQAVYKERPMLAGIIDELYSKKVLT